MMVRTLYRRIHNVVWGRQEEELIVGSQIVPTLSLNSEEQTMELKHICDYFILNYVYSKLFKDSLKMIKIPLYDIFYLFPLSGLLCKSSKQVSNQSLIQVVPLGSDYECSSGPMACRRRPPNWGGLWDG